jgi:hypothetical protein
MNEHLKGHRSLADMVSTHIETWRGALIARRDTPHINPVQVDFINHELKALRDIEDACKVEIAQTEAR